MTEWTDTELAIIATEDEIHLSSRRDDGSLRPPTTMWAVAVEGTVVVRSARQVNPWFERALASGAGRVQIGGLEQDVLFALFTGAGEPIDDAHHRKYDRYGARTVAGVVGADSYPRTLLVAPAN